MANDKLDEKHLHFTQWAVSQGVEINGVGPAKFTGRGLGMIATRVIEDRYRVKEDEVLIAVPLSAMLTIDCVPPSFVNLFPDGTSIHAILTAFLVHGNDESREKLDPWIKVWPTRREFEDSMPVLWPEKLRISNSSSHGDPHPNNVILPPSASGLWNSFSKSPVKDETRYQNLLAQQEKRLRNAWRKVISVFPDTDWDAFSYHWLILNTRSFFYVSPGEDHPEDWNDAIGLVPFADYFNHADDSHCEVDFDGQRYTFKATRRYEQGEEIYISYGSHTNDFLLVEYGFFLDDNSHDAIYLDDLVFRDLTGAEKKELDSQDYLGNYQATTAGVCFRTEVAASLKYMTRKNWRNYILGHSSRGVIAKKTESIIRGWIEAYLSECRSTVEILQNMLSNRVPASQDAAEDGLNEWEAQRVTMVLRRWDQIKRLCEDSLGALAC